MTHKYNARVKRKRRRAKVERQKARVRQLIAKSKDSKK